MKETVKKTMIAMKQTWEIEKTRFKNNYEKRMKIYDSLVISIMLYVAEI